MLCAILTIATTEKMHRIVQGWCENIRLWTDILAYNTLFVCTSIFTSFSWWHKYTEWMMPVTGVSQGLCICTNTKATRTAEFNRTCCSVSSAGEGVGCSIVNTFCIYIIAPEARFCNTANSWHWGFSMYHTSAVLIGFSKDDWEEV